MAEGIRKRRVLVAEDEMLSRAAWQWLVFRLAGNKCNRCGATECELDAHHIDGNDKNNTLANGECLCKPCHARHHHGGRKQSQEERQKRSEVMKRVRAERGDDWGSTAGTMRGGRPYPYA